MEWGETSPKTIRYRTWSQMIQNTLVLRDRQYTVKYAIIIALVSLIVRRKQWVNSHVKLSNFSFTVCEDIPK